MWFTTVILIIFIIIVCLLLHDIRQILQLQNELVKEQYIIRGEMNFLMDMALQPQPHVTHGPRGSDGSHLDEKKDETTTVEVDLST
jgi:hypothetical protein